MNEAVIKLRLSELSESIKSSPRLGKSGGKATGTYEPVPRAHDPSLDESMEHLKLLVDYLLFDLEATRRENRYLRQMLENRNNDRAGGEGEAR